MEIRKATRKLIRADGSEVTIVGQISIEDIHDMIGTGLLARLPLSDGAHVMLLDAVRQHDLPRNLAASQVYWEQCNGTKDYFIAGDVVIAPDADFA